MEIRWEEEGDADHSKVVVVREMEVGMVGMVVVTVMAMIQVEVTEVVEEMVVTEVGV